jgi:hypothetical protein
MSFLGQSRRLLMRSVGLGRVIDQRDAYLAQRNEFQRQLAEAKRVQRPTADALRDLAGPINAFVGQPGAIFFHTVEGAREVFLRRRPKLEDQLLGVKLINLLIAKHEYLWGAIATTARPIGFMLDPANQCQLGCPSCTNSFNRDFAASFKPWPRGLMTEATFDGFAREVALYAFNGHFYNNHEPLLNRLTPRFVRKAADLRVRTFISSNLSYRRIDAEAIVASGLTELMVAADGATQAVYERYRRSGNLAWVLGNARAIVAAKRKLGSSTPILRWQFLTFAHNVHEVEAAIGLAREIGFDTFNLATPNSIKDDDPSIDAIVYAGPEAHKSVRLIAPPPTPFTGNLDHARDLIEAALAESVLERWQRVTGDRDPADDDATGDRCDWLNLAVISDATGRIVPCCIGDYVGMGRFDFSSIAEAGGNIMNSVAYRQARQAVLNPEASAVALGDVADHDQVACLKCPGRPRPQVGLDAVGRYVAETPAFADMTYLHDWSRHTPLGPHASSDASASG